MTSKTDTIQSELLHLALAFLKRETDDENAFRGLMALGMLMQGDERLKEMAKKMDVEDILHAFSGSLKTRDVVDEIRRSL